MIKQNIPTGWRELERNETVLEGISIMMESGW